MTAALTMLAAGLAGTHLIRARSLAGTPRLAIAAHLVALLPARGGVAALRAARVLADTRRRLLAVASPRPGYGAVPGLGTVAVTVGLLRPVVLVARALAAGLHPWPGARIAQEEIRRHLEAAADDHAARRSSPRCVARAIAVAAAGGLAAAGLLGVQSSLHALAGAHFFPLTALACHV